MGSLCLGRKRGESITLADGEIIIEVVRIKPDQVRLKITAPSDIPILRTELIAKDDLRRVKP